MSSVRKTEKMIKKLLASHQKKVNQIKSKLSEGTYEVSLDKVAKAFCKTMDTEMLLAKISSEDSN